jgi:glycosidase
MRVLFDVVLNHSSLYHPYAIDRVKHGEASHYYDFYQYEDDGTPYSSFYNQDENGFINYFWPHLPNFNYDNEEVQRWMLEACKHWIREFDIDGYRLDAIWGVNARKPSFAKRLRTELKSIKPEVLLLAEAKGSDPEVFELGYEAAYDWMPDSSWVSQWSWEYEYNEEENLTLFNHPDVPKRTELLRHALFNNGGNYHRQLRFIENNDLPRFLEDHTLEQKKMAAALVFAIPGLPMLYNGQEIGKMGHPYRTSKIFSRDSSIQDLDQKDLFDYYKKIIGVYNHHASLRDTTMQEIPVAQPNQFVALHRWNEEENIVVIINMHEKGANANININNITSNLNGKRYQLKDSLNGKNIRIKKNHSRLKVPMEGYSVRILEIQKI